MKKPLKNWVRFPRQHIQESAALSDPAFRMYCLLQCLAVWDSRKPTFGLVDLSLRTIWREYFSFWSLSKVSLAVKELIAKGWVYRENQTTLRVLNPWQKSKQSVLLVQHTVSPVKQPVLPTRHSVPPIKHEGAAKLETDIQNLAKKFTIP